MALEQVGQATLRVRDVMSTPVVTAKQDDPVKKLAKVMEKCKIGSVVIVSGGKPIGIVTDRDIAIRVVGRGSGPSTKAGDVMSAPLLTISPNATLEEAAEQMRRAEVKRLVVLERGRLVGLISMRDIALASQQLLGILAEREEILKPGVTRPQPALAGFCQACGNWSTSLKEIEGRFLCEDCRADLAG